VRKQSTSERAQPEKDGSVVLWDYRDLAMYKSCFILSKFLWNVGRFFEREVIFLVNGAELMGVSSRDKGVILRCFLLGYFSENNWSSKLLEILLLQNVDGFGRQKVKHADSTLVHVHVAIVSREVMSQRERKSQKHRQHNHSN